MNTVIEDQPFSLQKELTALEQRVTVIETRNARVEADKAWEISNCRIMAIAVITYLCAAIVLRLIGVERYLLSALVPTIGYYLSTQTLPVLKLWWLKRRETAGTGTP